MNLRSRALAPFGIALFAIAFTVSPVSASVPGEVVRSAVAVAAGNTATLYANTEFKITGTCIHNGGSSLTAHTYIKTKVDNAIWWISSDSTYDLDFDRADGRIRFDVFYQATGTSPDFWAHDYYQEVTALSASGKLLIARTATGVHVLGAGCTFSGLYQAGSAVRNAVSVAAGSGTTLFENRQFKVTGRCVDNGGGEFAAETYIKTKKDNAIYSRGNLTALDLDFDRADGEVGVDTNYQASGPTPAVSAGDYDRETYAISASGKVLIARALSGVHLLGADCIFAGLFQSGSRVRNVVNVAAGNSTTLFENAQFKVSGTCTDNGGGSLTAQTLIQTKQNNALRFMSRTGIPDTDFDSSEGNVSIDGAQGATGATAAFMAEDYRQEVYAVSAGGKVLIYRTATGVHVLGSDCTFSGRINLA